MTERKKKPDYWQIFVLIFSDLTSLFQVSDHTPPPPYDRLAMTEDVERQPLLGPDSTLPVEQNGVNNSSTTTTTVSPIGPDELPPPYNTLAGGVPMVSCRVCSNMIDISGKKDQVRENSETNLLLTNHLLIPNSM